MRPARRQRPGRLRSAALLYRVPPPVRLSRPGGPDTGWSSVIRSHAGPALPGHACLSRLRHRPDPTRPARHPADRTRSDWRSADPQPAGPALSDQALADWPATDRAAAGLAMTDPGPADRSLADSFRADRELLTGNSHSGRSHRSGHSGQADPGSTAPWDREPAGPTVRKPSERAHRAGREHRSHPGHPPYPAPRHRPGRPG
jgi:hypothetical protein